MGTFTKKVLVLAVTFALGYTASVIGVTYSVDYQDLIVNSNAGYDRRRDHIYGNSEYLEDTSRKLLAETVLHELAHWTAHSDRDNRSFADKYHEEIVAELTVLIVCDILDLKYASQTLEETIDYLEYHNLARSIDEVDIKRAQDEAQSAAVHLIKLLGDYGLFETKEPFDVVKAVFPEFAAINRSDSGGKDAQ